MTVALYAIKRPGYAVGLIFTMFGMEQFFQTRSVIFLDRSYLVNLGVGVVAAMAAGIWLLHRSGRFKLDKVQIACLMMILLSQLSQFWTIAPDAFQQYYARSPWPYYILYLVIAPILTQGKDSTRNGVWATLYIGIPLVFLIVFYVEWSGRGIMLARPIMEKGRLRSFTPPLALASLASYICIMCVVLKPKNFLWKLLHLATFALAGYIVYRTQSRGQLVALAIVVLVFYPIANRASRFKELFFTLAGFIIFGAAIYLVFSYFDLGDVNRWTDSSITRASEGRYFMVTALLTEWGNSGPARLLFGLGSAAGWKTSTFAVHNFPAEVLGELGVVGFSIYLFIVIQTFSNSLKIVKKLKHYPEMRREAVVLIALFTFTTILSLKSISLFSSAPLMFYFAIAISQLERHSRQYSSEKLNWKSLLLNSGSVELPSRHRPDASSPRFGNVYR